LSEVNFHSLTGLTPIVSYYLPIEYEAIGGELAMIVESNSIKDIENESFQDYEGKL
jgi:hypothetical protein